MRPFLNALNSTNLNIKTFQVYDINLHSNETESSIGMNCWVDFCQDYLCFQMKQRDTFVRLHYKSFADVKAKQEKSFEVILFHSIIIIIIIISFDVYGQ